MIGGPPTILVATTKGTLRAHKLTTDQARFNVGVTLFQDETHLPIADLAVTKCLEASQGCFVVLAIGNGEVLVVALTSAEGGGPTARVVHREKICDIKLLSCHVAMDCAEDQ